MADLREVLFPGWRSGQVAGLSHGQYRSNVLSDQCPEQMWVSTLGEMELWARDVG